MWDNAVGPGWPGRRPRRGARAESRLAVGSLVRRGLSEPASRARVPARYGRGQGSDDDAVATAVASVLGKKPQSLSPAPDSLLKELIYSGERGQIAFTVPHFGRYLRSHSD